MLSRMLFGMAAVLALGAPALAKPGTVTTVNLRAEANTTSDVLAKMPAGGRLDAGECAGGRCAVTFQGQSGFAIATALNTNGRVRRVRRAPRPVYVPDDVIVPAGPPYARYPEAVYVVPGPVYRGPYWGPWWGARWGW